MLRMAKVLLFEDNEDVIIPLSRLLRNKVKLVVAKTILDACRAIRNNLDADIVVFDCNMPVKSDGEKFGTTNGIVRYAQKHTKALLIAASGSNNQELREAGCTLATQKMYLIHDIERMLEHYPTETEPVLT